MAGLATDGMRGQGSLPMHMRSVAQAHFVTYYRAEGADSFHPSRQFQFLS